MSTTNDSLSRMLVAVILFALIASVSSAQWPKRQKKLVQYGSLIFEDDVRRDIRKMEELPFDGILFMLRNYSKAFDHENRWDEKKMAPQVETLRSIEWNTFTDNFLMLKVASEQDWFNDDHWDTILHNIRLFTKAAMIGRCKGICIDPEAYGTSPWIYDNENQRPAHFDTKTFEEYCRQVRKRGAQYMQAIESVNPDVHIMTLYLLTCYHDLLRSPDHNSDTTFNDLKHDQSGMFFAFVNGLLDAMGPGVTITDGNEDAYSYCSPAEYDRAYVDIKQRYLYLVAPENRIKYRQQVQVGSALFADAVFGTYQNPASVLGSFLGPGDRLRLFEHNVYHALNTADEYVWCYTERINWFADRLVPDGAYEAIRRARRRIAERQLLEYNMDNEVASARQAQKAALEGRLAARSHVVPKRSASQRHPVIDGVLNDAIWRQGDWMEPFVPLLTMLKPASDPKTYTKVVWDDDNLYVAFKCIEPQVSRIRRRTRRRGRDTNIWGADVIEVFICQGQMPKPIYHFGLTPTNVQWDSVITNDNPNDVFWNGTWQSGISFGKDHWTAEFAFPWDQIGGAPKPLERRKANLARLRDPDPKELSSWSPLRRLFNEVEHYGTWVFGE